MNKLFAILICIFLVACASKKDTTPVLAGTPVLHSPCPPDGTCNVTLQKDKGLFERMDKLNRLHYEIVDKPGTVVITYSYNKTKNPDYQDGSYSEEVVFETDAQYAGLKNRLLPTMYFTVNCFCRGKAGTYAVNGGEVRLSDNDLEIVLPQIVDSQLTQQISILFK